MTVQRMKLTELEYRALDIDSYSSIKVFLEDRKDYYKRFVLKEADDRQDTDELIFGSLVDCLLFSPDDYDSRYSLASSKIPTGQYGKLVTALWSQSVLAMDEDNNITRSLEPMLEDAYNAVKFDRNGEVVDFKRDTLDTAKRKFSEDHEGIQSYYNQLKESYGKVIIELVTLDKAQAVVNELKTNWVTREIVNLENDSRYTVFNQFPIIQELDGAITKSVGYKLKCLIDKLVIDHEKKFIYIYDLKTASNNESGFQYNYFKYKYYIQMAVYFYLTVEWKKTIKEISEYAVIFPKFIVAESSNYKNPLIYTTNMGNFNQGMRGFEIGQKYYPGVIKAVRDMIWHREVGTWNISRDNYDSNGIVVIKPFDINE